jgi:hypothetical protein
MEEASKSLIKCQLAAAVIKGQKFLSRPCSNSPKNICRGISCGSVHAETRAIIDCFGKDLIMSPKNGGTYYIPKEKRIKCDLIVIRINKDDKICTSRPCFRCLSLMKAVGIRKVYYTDNDQNLICENVKDMISINASSVTRLLLKRNLAINISDNNLLENLLINLFPDKVKKINLQYFIQYDFSFALPLHKCLIENHEGKNIVVIYNQQNEEVIKALLID